jgi:Flp pilus assembly protein TadG
MSQNQSKTRGHRSLWRCRRGQGLTELALSVPLLMILALGMIEVNRAIETNHVISTLTREGANVASRGSTLDETVAATRTGQQATGLGTVGGVVASEIVVTNGIPRIVAQATSAGLTMASQVGMPDSVAVPYQATGLTEGRSYFVVEMFLPYQSMTGFDKLMPGLTPQVLYDRTLF